MKVYEVNQTKVYAVGEYNEKELCDFNDIVESIKQHDYGVNLIIAKVPTSDDLCEKIKEELLSIDDQGFKDLLSGKLSETTKFGIYSNILDISKSFKNYPKRFNSILFIGNISKASFDPNRPDRSIIIQEHDIYSLYKDYCKSCLLSKYNNKIRIIPEVYININDLKSYSIQTPSDINIIYNIRWEKRNLPSCICSESLNSIDPHYNCNYSTLSYCGINLEKSNGLLIYNKDRKNDLKEYFNILQEIKIYNSDYNNCSDLENYIIFDLLNISKEEKEDILKEWFDIINSYINECGYFGYDFNYEDHASYNQPTLILLSKELVDWDKGEFINKFINSNSLTFPSFKSFAVNELLKR